MLGMLSKKENSNKNIRPSNIIKTVDDLEM